MPYFDRFDICEAHYIFAMLWHNSGVPEPDGKIIYQKFSQLLRLGFKPRPGLDGPKDLEENGHAIYWDLVAKLAQKAVIPR